MRYSSNVSILTCLLANRENGFIKVHVHMLLWKKIKTDKNLLKDLHYLSDFSHTDNLEVYHSLCNKFCQKQLCFSMHGLICRTMIAVLEHN